jgi:glycerate kinase
MAFLNQFFYPIQVAKILWSPRGPACVSDGFCKLCQVLGLVLSDVIGDPLEVIASGPTVPEQGEAQKALQVLDKYGVKFEIAVLSAEPEGQSPIKDEHVFNVVIGNNKMAATAAKETAIQLGYASYVWSVQVRGEASFLGHLYAMISHYLLMRRCALEKAELDASRDLLYEGVKKLLCECPELEEDISSLMRVLEMVKGGPFCLVGSGEPTVRVIGKGRGGRNQELALAYAIKMHELREKICRRDYGGNSCLFASLGTDGQDGPCDAAGAIIDPSVVTTAQEQGLSPAQSLLDNDSHTFFSLLNSGANLIRTGLTGTNVMDVHMMLMR